MTSLYFEDVGRGPVVLLLHAAPGRGESFAPIVAALKATHRLLVPDMPGYGRSAPWQGPYSLAPVTDLLVDGLRTRGVDELAIVGHSLGGYRALALALTGRLRVRSLVLLTAFAELSADDREGYRGFAQLLRMGQDVHPMMIARSLAPEYAVAHPDEARSVGGLLDIVPAQVLAQEMDAIAACEDLKPRLQELSMPVTVRVGEKDTAISVASCEVVARGVRRGTLQIVPNCGHTLLMEDRDATVEAVKHAV